MPKIYRAMEMQNGVPKIGESRNMLGVRTPPNATPDIIPDDNGDVAPEGTGMSVNPSQSVMMLVHIPRRWRELDVKFKFARGEEPVEVFTLGEGAFVKAVVATNLILNPTSSTHGVVEPAQKMPLPEYKQALAATQFSWQFLDQPDGS